MGEPGKVMIVDDDLMGVMAAERELESAGWEVVRLSSPNGALSKIDFEAPDALLVDITMDRLNADDVIETLRGSPDHRDIVIVVYADESAETLQEYCVDHDVNGYFRKTMDVSEIAGFLDNFFD